AKEEWNMRQVLAHLAVLGMLLQGSGTAFAFGHHRGSGAASAECCAPAPCVEYKTEYRQVQRVVYHCVPETHQQTISETVMVPVWHEETRQKTCYVQQVHQEERQRTVCHTEWKTEQRQKTVMV